MNTRLIEKKSAVRASVARAAVLSVESASLVLKTQAPVAVWKPISSADVAMFEQASDAREGEIVEGRLQIDAVADGTLRFRYAEGNTIPENATEMLAGPLPIAENCTIERVNDRVEIQTPTLRAVVWLDPYRVEVFDRDGRRVTTIGGPEKNGFARWDAVNTGLCRDGDITVAAESFALAPDESVYGFGEKFIRLDKAGQTIDLFAADALGVTTPRSYKNVPFYASTRGYGLFLNHSSPVTCWVGSLSAVDIQIAVEDDFLDYFVFVGTIKGVLSRYTDVTGRGALPPKWTFGYWQSKISYTSAKETLEIAGELRRHGVPCDVIHLDTHWFKADWYCDLEFDPERFPDPAGYIARLHEMGFRVSVWQLPYIPSGSALYDAIDAVGGFVRNADGSIYDLGLCFTEGFTGTVGVVDFTNPEAVRVYREALARLFRLGVAIVKADFGESAPLDGVYADGTPGRQMHNLYPLLYNRAVFDVTREETGEGAIWARSAWAGCQRYPLHWGGDNSPNYANIVPQLQGGLSLGLSGFQFWSQDIGGFRGSTTDALLVRWMQLGMFLSHARIHGSGDRELYKFAPETLGICRDYIRLRYRLLPYIHGAAKGCVEESLPMARALVVEYQDDPNVRNIGDEFLLGDALLVAPICDEGTHRRVYLPAGTWTDWWTRERIPGGRWIEVEADVETLPLFVREGRVVALGPEMNHVGEVPVRRVELRVSLFEREGESACYVSLDDEFVRVAYAFDGREHRLRIGPSDVAFDVVPLGHGAVTVVRDPAL